MAGIIFNSKKTFTMKDMVENLSGISSVINFSLFKSTTPATTINGILEYQTVCSDRGTNSFGFSIDTNNTGDRVIVGAYGYNFTQGKAYVYVRSGSSWVLEAQLTCPDGRGSYFGYSVSMNSNGDKIIIGGCNYNSLQGKVYIYTRSGSNWTLEKEIVCPDNGTNFFGASVSINSDGTRIIVGAHGYNSFQGKIYIFAKSGNDWILEQGIICPDNMNIYFGISVSMDNTGNRVIIGGYNYNSGQGKVYIYAKSNDSWISEAQIVNPDNEVSYFGRSVSMSDTGNKVIVSGYGCNKVYIYTRSDSSWTPEAQIVCPDNGNNRFGISVSINSTGDRVIVGAHSYNSGQGKAYVYLKSNDSWILENQIVCPKDGNNCFGYSVTIDSIGNRVIIGAYNYNSSQGKIYIYT